MINKMQMSSILQSFSYCRKYEEVTPILEPVIEEATSVLREWGGIAKDLFLVSLCIFNHFYFRLLSSLILEYE